MTIPLVEYNEILNVLGLPQVIKGISFYPIKLLDDELKQLFYSIFSYSKSQMYDLNNKFVLEQDINVPWINIYLSEFQRFVDDKSLVCMVSLKEFLKRICKTDEVVIGCDDRTYVPSCDTIVNQNVVVQFAINEEKNGKLHKKYVRFDGWETEWLREMIMLQNNLSPTYIDEWRKGFEEDVKMDAIVKKNNEHSSLSDDVITYKEMAHISDEELSKMTLYQFGKGYEKAKQLYEYKLIYPAYSAKKLEKGFELRHYSLPVKNPWRYSHVARDVDEFKEKNKDLL